MPTDPNDDRLDEVQRKIDEARESAEEAIPELEDDEPRYHESGTIGREDDDQTATPG